MSKRRVKTGIYAIAILMMGNVGVAGSLTVIGEAFPEASQSTIQSIISLPCLSVLPATILSGKLMAHMPKKILALVGVIIFLIGGVMPFFLRSLPLILFFRIMFGIGVGTIQAVASALVAENFEGPERESVQGTMTSAQMLGCALMVFAGGWLGSQSWNYSFLVHMIAGISLVVAVVCLPLTAAQSRRGSERDPAGVEEDPVSRKTKLTFGSWSWAAITLLLFLGVQVYSIYISYILDEKSLGGAGESGATVSVACIGGFIMGILYGRFSAKAKDLTFATGLFIMALSYVVVAFATSMTVIYAGGFIYGLAMSITMPAAFVNTANSVDLYSSAMALSITMCAQNLGQFLCPYFFNTVVGLTGSDNPSMFIYIIAALLLTIMGAVATVWGMRKGKRS